LSSNVCAILAKSQKRAFTKIHAVGFVVVHEDGRTDGQKWRN